MLFHNGNNCFRDGAYDKAAQYYIEALRECGRLTPVCFNLGCSLRKISDTVLVNQLLHDAFSALYPKTHLEKYARIASSGLVDEGWYRESYKDWLNDEVNVILHYLVVGWCLGFNPSASFDGNAYLPANFKFSVKSENPLIHFLYKKDKEKKRKEKKVSETSNLAIQLWNGHSESALKALEALHRDENNTEVSRWWALWHIARWRYFCGEFEQALALAKQMQQLGKANRSRKETVYLVYFCLLMLGQPKEAYTELQAYVQQNPDDADAKFALANAVEDDQQRIALINQAYAVHGFSGIRLKDKAKPLSMSNVVGLPAAKVKGRLKVSIVMPIYNAGEQVRIAIESLLAQTYENIEIIAVDDCSPDNTFEILKALEKQDARVKAVQPIENGGAYAARNVGLSHATGDLLTTHDSDDWSHPQKIATQVAYLEQHPDVKGCSAHWIRAHENLAFTQNWRPNNMLIHWSQSSFMFRREVLESIGEWDHVRIGGDTEYIWRMQAHFGKKAFAKIYSDTPLAFALDEESSLTRTKATHVRTVYFGLRHIYREICAWWHANHANLHVKNAKEKRTFTAPRSMFERSDEPLVFDTVIAGDFSRLQDCQQAARWVSQHRSQKVALFHWPSFHKDPEPLCNLYFEMLQQGKVEPIVMGQVVKSHVYAVTEQDLLNYPLDGYPEFLNHSKWQPV